MRPLRALIALALPWSGMVAACGQLTPLESGRQPCPCASGYMCVDDLCILGCPGTLELGTETVAGDPQASIAPSTQTVTGALSEASDGVLPEGSTTAFDYATSLWPKPYGWQLDGWFVAANAGESYSFSLWVDDDGGSSSLPLVVYGPLGGLGTDTCTGSLLGGGPMSGASVDWQAPADGLYFAAPYHTVSETSAGLAFEGLNDDAYGHAFITMTRDGT